MATVGAQLAVCVYSMQRSNRKVGARSWRASRRRSLEAQLAAAVVAAALTAPADAAAASALDTVRGCAAKLLGTGEFLS